MANLLQQGKTLQDIFAQTRRQPRRTPAVAQPTSQGQVPAIPSLVGLGHIGNVANKIPTLSQPTSSITISKKERDEIVTETARREAELPLLTISKSAISLYSWEEMQRIAGPIKVTNLQLQGHNSVNDPRMGVVSMNMACEYCSQIDCPGHFGLIDFKTMIYNPAFIREIVSVLSCVCNDCGGLLITEDIIKQQGFHKLGYEKRLAAMEDFCKKDLVCLRQKPVGQGGHIIPCAKNPIFITTDIRDKGEITFKIPQEGNRQVTANDPIHIMPISRVAEIFHRISPADEALLGFTKGDIFKRMTKGRLVELLSRLNPLELTHFGFPQNTDPKDLPRETLVEHIENIPPAFQREYGFVNGSRIRDMIMRGILVPPIIARPPVYEGGAIHHDQLTTMYISILRKVNEKSGGTKSGSNENLYTAVKQLIFKTEGKKMGTREFLSIIERIQGKTALLRGLLMGKRVNFCGRTVAGPDATLRFKQVRVPQTWAPVLTKEQTVTNFNIYNLTQMLEAGRITHITPKKSGLRKFYDNRFKYRLQIGDKVERLLQNDDLMIANRQPTLHKQSMMAYKTVLGFQQTLGLHICYTPPMNCDFDGDECNGWIPRDIETEAEAEVLLNVENNVMSSEQNKPIMGLVQNGIYGAYVLTKPDSIKSGAVVNGFPAEVAINRGVDLELLEKSLDQGRVDPNLVNRLLGVDGNRDPRVILAQAEVNGEKLTSVYQRLIENGDVVEGTRLDDDLFGELISMLTDQSQLATLYQRLIKYGVHPRSGRAMFSALLPDDFYYNNKGVVIIEGVLISGRITKDHVGTSHRSIIQELWKNYGSERTSDFFTDSTWIINKWLIEHGFSVGILDCINLAIDEKTGKEYDRNKRVLDQELSKIYVELEALGGKIDDPLEEFYRKKQINSLVNIANGIGLRLAKEVLSGDNSIGIMSDQGSKAKGGLANIGQMMGAVGQQYFRGERLKPTITGGTRLLPAFDENDNNPEANAFIPESFYTGITPEGLFFLQAGGREGLLDTALKTAETGDMQHRMIKAFENVIVSNDGSIRNTMGTMFSPMYNCGYDIGEMVAVQSLGMEGLSSFIDLKSTIAALNVKRGWIPPDINRHIISSRALLSLTQHLENVLEQPSDNYVKGPLVTNTEITYNIHEEVVTPKSHVKINKYEKARILGTRAMQLANNAVPLVDISYTDDMDMLDVNRLLDPLSIAKREYAEGLLQLYIVRKYADGSYEKVYPTLDNI